MKKTMPIGMLALFLSMFVLAALYAHMAPWESGLLQGTGFGILIGIFVLCAFVIHNHMMLNVSRALTFQSGIAYFIEWAAAGVTIGFIYHPA